MNRLLPTLLLLACALPAGADDAQTRGFFAALAGDWQGEGEVLGMASVQRARWGPALGAAFFRFSFDNRMTAADGRQSHFQAEAYYRVDREGAVSGTWLDSRGMTLPIAGGLDQAGTLVMSWGTPETEQGRSSYRLDAEALEITDEVLTAEGVWRVFGRTRLTRVAR